MNDDSELHYKEELEERLKQLGVWYNFVEKDKSTVHTADAAKVTGIDLHRISKNLIAKTSDGRYASLIIPGDRALDFKAAAEALNTKTLHLLPFDKTSTISGYPPGGTPSLGYKENIEVILDEELKKYETFFCGGGSTRFLLEVRRDDVIKINNAKTCKISKTMPR